MIDGKEHGIHAFVVQLRSFENHRVLAGMTSFFQKYFKKNEVSN